MAGLAKAADICVVVAAPKGERGDMVRHGGCCDEAARSADAAKRLRFQTALALRLACAAAEALNHERRGAR